MAEADVVELLRAQHARMEQLFREVINSTGDVQREQFEELARLVVVHETIEQEVVHPASRYEGRVDEEVVDARLGEELDAEELLAEIYERGIDDPEFPVQIRVLRDAVLRHSVREERYEFPHLQKYLDPRERARLAEAVHAAEMLAPTRPHPELTAAGTAAEASPLALVNRVRAAVHDAMQ